MSIRVMQWVWDNSNSRNGSRLVLLAIADCASDDGGQAWPSIATIAAKAHLSVRATQTSIRELVALGELEVNAQTGPAGCNRYRVLMVEHEQTPFGRVPLIKRKISAQTRLNVFARDGYTCRHCGVHADLTLDHIIPESHGGSDEMTNLQTLCRPCNSLKGVRNPHPADSSANGNLHPEDSSKNPPQGSATGVQGSAKPASESAPVTVHEPSIEPSEEPSAARERTRIVIELADEFRIAMPISNRSRTRSVIAVALSAGATPARVRAALNKLIEQNRGCTEETLRIALTEARAGPTTTTNGRVQAAYDLSERYKAAESHQAIEG